MSEIPSVRLDFTLSDLFKEDDISNEVAYLPTWPSSDVDVSKAVPRSVRYLYLGSRFPLPPDFFSMLSLSLGVQQLGFTAGKMPLLAFDMDESATIDSSSFPESKSDRIDVLETLEALNPEVRPEVSFVPGPKDIRLENPNSKLSVSLPIDCLESYPHVVDPDVHYELATKRALALSGLQTPEAKLIEYGLPSNLSEEHKFSWIEAHLARVKKTLEAQTLPFVLKLNQATGGDGTYVTRTTVEQENLINDISIVLRKLLPRVNAGNAHLHPASLIITGFLPSPATAVSFFVKKNGDPVFVCAATQKFTPSGQWIGGSVNYRMQAYYEDHYREMINQIASFLKSRGYYGAAGADIMEDENGRLWVVDINVRMPGAFNLGCLRTHFLESRGLNESCFILGLRLNFTRRQFIEHFGDEFRAGRVIIVAWYHDRTSFISWANIVVGAEDEAAIDTLIQRVESLRAF